MWTDYLNNLKALLQDLAKSILNVLHTSITMVSFWEVLFLLLVVGQYIVLFLGWRSYEIEFVSTSGSLHYIENIITNDFFVLFLLLAASLLPPLVYLLFQHCHCKQRLLQFRIGILSIITFIYIANTIWIERTASTPIAHFTFAFYAFGTLLFLAWFIGIKAIQSYQKTTEEKEFSIISNPNSLLGTKFSSTQKANHPKTEKKRQ